jgi:hypothetical protein
MSGYKPDFIAIGTEKSGTSWLGKCVEEHPEIKFPKNKELYFFNDVDSHFLKKTRTKYGRGIGWYFKQFEGIDKQAKKGDWSITYMCTKETARRIKKHLPKVKMIACLRNPVERAFSQYLYEIRLGLINPELKFIDILKARPDFIEKGFYAKQLKNYFQLFDKRQILILIYENLKADPKSEIKRVFEFLNLKDTEFIPPSLNKKVNQAGKAVFPSLNLFMLRSEYFMRAHGFDPVLRLLEKTGVRNIALKIRDMNNNQYAKYPRLGKRDREYLYSLYKEDMRDLSKLIKEDISVWVK